MTNRPLYVRKYHSGRLKGFNYNINDFIEESKFLNEIIGLSDSQILRTIRQVGKRTLNKEHLEKLIICRDFYRKQLANHQLPETKRCV